MSHLQKLVLASGSPRRVDLLQQAGIEPDRLFQADVDERPMLAEHPRLLAKRLSMTKAKKAYDFLSKEAEPTSGFILSADTVVAVGRRILPKAKTSNEALRCLKLLSGRSHRVYTGLALVTPAGKLRQRVVETRVCFKRLSKKDIENYLASGEWCGKAGCYGIQGLAGTFVVKLVGSYTNVVGLPLYETTLLLSGEGYQVQLNWQTWARI